MSVTVRAEVDGVLRAGDSRARTADVLNTRLRQQPVGAPPLVEWPEVVASSFGRLHVTMWFEDGSDPAMARVEAERRLRVALAGWQDSASVWVNPWQKGQP